jgi:hypothetical protein
LVTFADRLLIHLANTANLGPFLSGLKLDAFFTADFQARFNSDFWQIAQVTVGATLGSIFEEPTWIETRILGREDHYGNHPSKTNVDYRVYGIETALWADATVELETVWQIDQFPGSIVNSPGAPSPFKGVANLVSVLRIDANNHPLDRSAGPLNDVTLDDKGRLTVVTGGSPPVALRLDPLVGALLLPGGVIHSLVLLELFPHVGPTPPLLGAPLGEDGQPLHDLHMNSSGSFTRFTGVAAPIDPLTHLPLDGGGKPVWPARLAIPGGDSAGYRFMFTFGVQTGRLTFSFITRLHLFVMPQFNLVDDLRKVLTLKHRQEQRQDTLFSLDDTANKQANAYALMYDSNSLTGTGLTQDEVARLGASSGILIHFVTSP